MNRLSRLAAPAMAFLITGLLVWITFGLPWATLTSGLLVAGAYSLLVGAVLASLGVAAVDDLRSQIAWGRPTGSDSLMDISLRPVSFRRALGLFYTRPFISVFALSLGSCLSVSAVFNGAFSFGDTRYSSSGYVVAFGEPGLTIFGTFATAPELGMAAVLSIVAVAFMIFRAPFTGYCGAVAGIALAAFMGEAQFASTFDLVTTLIGWASFAGFALVIRAIVVVAFGGVHRRRPVSRTP
jgi:hypothetical protein